MPCLPPKISFINEVSASVRRSWEPISAKCGARSAWTGASVRTLFFPASVTAARAFLKDIRATISMGGDEPDMLLLKAVEAGQRTAKGLARRKSEAPFWSTILSGHTFAIWGLAFKPRTDDMRDAPSITVIESLLQAGAKVQAHSTPRRWTKRGKSLATESSYARRNYDALAWRRGVADV